MWKPAPTDPEIRTMDEQSCEDLYSVNRNSNASDKHLFRLAGRADVRVDEWMDGCLCRTRVRMDLFGNSFVLGDVVPYIHIYCRTNNKQQPPNELILNDFYFLFWEAKQTW